MTRRAPLANLPTHEVTNQPPPLENINLFDTDLPLLEAVRREGGAAHEERFRRLGETLGRDEWIRKGRLANDNPPVLHQFDRYGHRIDEVEFHPAYHELMALGIEAGVSALAWTGEGESGHLAHTAIMYLMTQVEPGVCCPFSMTYAAVPALRNQPEIAAEWEPRIVAGKYDPRMIPAVEKAGVTVGMAMTEKQGGSDVRANTTRAVALNGGGSGGAYELTGHKWFCSAPMSDAFLTLAYTGAGAGLSCFFVPRWTPDGERNPFFIQRLKDKLGNKANASSEIEYNGTHAWMVGEEGRGVATIIDMVHHTRLSTSMAPTALMRQALAQAAHHVRHRRAFQKTLIDQPAMKNVIADLALELEGAVALLFRMARAYDRSATEPAEAALARIGIAVAKYWLNKRAPQMIYECLECLGGAGFIEDGPIAWIYREAPLNSIWEGSGNVICLDVLRAIQRNPESIEAFIAEVESARGSDPRLDRHLDRLAGMLSADTVADEAHARRLVETMALALQGGLVVRHAPNGVADAWCASRLDADWGHTYGTLPAGADMDAIIGRVLPA